MIPRLNMSKINNRGGAAAFATTSGVVSHPSHTHGQHGAYLPYTAGVVASSAAEPGTAHTTTEDTGRTPMLMTPRGSATPATAHGSHPTSRVTVCDGAAAPSSAHTLTEGVLRSSRLELPPNAVLHSKAGLDEAGGVHATGVLQSGGPNTARSARAASLAVNSTSFARRALELAPLLGFNVQLCQDVPQLQLKLLEMADRLERTESYYERQLQERSQYFQHRLGALIAFLAQTAEEPAAESAQAPCVGLTPTSHEKTRRGHRRVVQIPVARPQTHGSAAGHATASSSQPAAGVAEKAGVGSSCGQPNGTVTTALTLDFAGVAASHQPHPQRHPSSPSTTAPAATAVMSRPGTHGSPGLGIGSGNVAVVGATQLSRTSASPTGVVHPFAILSPTTTLSTAADSVQTSFVPPLVNAAPPRVGGSVDVAHVAETTETATGGVVVSRQRMTTPTTVTPSHEISEAGVGMSEAEAGAELRAARAQVGGTPGGGGSLLARVQRRNRQRREYTEGYGVHLASASTSHASHSPPPSAS